jgi:hypothetical protein
MKTAPQKPAGSRGAAMMVVLMLTIVGGIAVTAWISLLAARLIQSDRMSDSLNRRLIWDNSCAINQQYAYVESFQDQVNNGILTTTLNGGWGGLTSDLLNALAAFRSVNNFTSPSTAAYPFSLIRGTPTADGSVYYTRSTGATDPSQVNRLLFYNYQKTYPRSLIGDLLIVHKKPTGAPATYYITDNLAVNDRVLIYDSTADVSGVAASECLNLTKTGTNTTLNSADSTVLLPQNLPSVPIFQVGVGGQDGGAVLDGSLNMCSNPAFVPGSIWDIMQAQATGYYTLSTNATSSPLVSGGNVKTNSNVGVSGTTTGSGAASDDIFIKTGNSVPTNGFAVPTTSPYNYTWPSGGSAVVLLLKSPTLYNINVVGGVTQLILQGQTTATDYTNAANLPPLIIWVQQEVRDIRFVGENSRPLILALGTGTGLTCYCGFSGNGIASANSVRWRMHVINQYRDLYLDPAIGKNYTLTGGIRTNWSIHCTDATGTTRFTLARETSPATLLPVLPRDAWLEPLYVQ